MAKWNHIKNQAKEAIADDDRPKVLYRYTPGHPTKYDESMPMALINHMAKGYSYKSFAGIIGVNLDTMYNWERLFPEWKNAKEHGKILELATWEKIHLRCAATGQGNASAIIWAQKNKFPDDYRADNNPNININTAIQNNPAVSGTTIVAWGAEAEKKLKELEAKTLEISALKDDDIINLL